MEPDEFSSQAEAFLFSEGGALSVRKLSELLKATPEQTGRALEELSKRLEGSGLSLVRTKNEAALVIAAGSADAVAQAYERELGKEIGEAGLEVLAVILYRGASTRAEIDYIRGVNTSSTLRTLLARGLLERVGNPKDGREYLYRPTTELLVHLGVRTATELPDYATITSELSAFEQKQQHFGQNNGTTDDTGGRTGD